jgi:hypothetical protein
LNFKVFMMAKNQRDHASGILDAAESFSTIRNGVLLANVKVR